MNLTRLYEEELEKWLQVKHAVVVNTGTAALKALVQASPIGKGDKVITTPYTYPPTITALLKNDAIPVFVDVYPDLTINTEQAEKAIKKFDAKGILPVHIFGRPCNIPYLKTLKEEYGLTIIEDACQAIGRKVEEGYLGTLFDGGALSTYFSKNLWTYQGGVALTNDDETAEKVRILRRHGFKDGKMIMLGDNWEQAQLLSELGRGMVAYHKTAILSELGRFSPEDGFYPLLVYQHPWYQENPDQWMKLPCPIAEKQAEWVRKNVSS